MLPAASNGIFLRLLRLLLLVTILHQGAAGQWEYTVSNTRQSSFIMNERLVALTSQSFIIRYQISPGTFLRFMTVINQRDFLPSICRSSSTTNRYGWERWKDEIFETIAFNPLTDMQILWRRLDGFALRESEDVFCGPLVSASGDPLFSPPLTVLDPPRFQFSFRRATAAPGLVMSERNGQGGGPGTPTETDIRRNGLRITLSYVNDVWNIDDRDAIFEAFTCTPGDCLRGILLPEHLNITEAEPHILRIFLNRVAIAMFNIDQLSTIAFTPTLQTSYKSELPQSDLATLRFNVFALSASPEVAVMQFVGGVYEELPDSEPLNLTEKCVRGRDSQCIRSIVINVVAGEGTFQPEAGAHQAVVNGFSGPPTFMAIRNTWISSLNVDPRTPFSLQIQLAASPQLDVWQPELLTMAVPGAVFRELEPPSNGPFTIRLLPSPGVVTWDPGEVTEDMIWDGDFSINITADGETWNQNEVRRALISSSFAVSANPGPDGWNAMKHSVIPPDSITFPASDTLTLTFRQQLMFDVLADETVTLVIPPEMMRSRLPVEEGGRLEFTILNRPGRGVMNPVRDFEERDVWGGTIAFNLTLTGESWVDDGAAFDQCRGDILQALTTDEPGQRGFGVETNRARFVNASGLTRVDRRNVVFRANAVPISMYDVETGERITLAGNRIPASCLLSRRSPETNLRINIIPQYGIISIHWATTDSGTDVGVPVFYRPPAEENATAPPQQQEFVGVSESRLRRGMIQLRIVSHLDYFTGVTPQEVFDGLVSDGVGVTGWNERKRFMLFTKNIDLSNRSQIVVEFPDLYAPFDVHQDELVTLALPASWMVSRRNPSSSAQFVIFAAPGMAELVTWTGASRDITEDDIRAGVVRFRFALVGDSWMRQRAPFVSSIVALNATLRGMSTFRDAVLPSASFFTFNYTEGIESLELVFQALEHYDVAGDDWVSIRFVNETVASRLSPTVVNMDGTEGLTFRVRATQGRVVMSGAVRNVHEKSIRQGRVTVLMTLFGETFALGSGMQLLNGFVGTDATGSGFNALKSYMLPPARVQVNESLATLRLQANHTYDVETEQLRFELEPSMFASGIVPASLEPLNIAIASSSGELTHELLGVADGGEFTEDTFRRDGLQLRLWLNGDTWNTFAIVERQPHTFLSGFSAQAPVIVEPRGFNANFFQWAPNYTVVDESTIIVTLCGACNGVDYDINEDEHVTFSVASSIFVNSDIPDPNAVTFTIRAIPREIYILFDEGAVRWQEGRVTMDRFRHELSQLLLVPRRRIVGEISREGSVSMVMHFTPSLRGTEGATVDEEADTRSANELSTLLLSLGDDFAYEHLFILHMHHADSPTPRREGPGGGGGDGSDGHGSGGGGRGEGLLDGPYGGAIWAGIAFVFIGVLGGLMLCNSRMKRANLPGTLRTGSDPASHQRKMGHSADGPQFDVGDDTYGFADPIDPRRAFAGQRRVVSENPLGLLEPEGTSLRDHVRRRIQLSGEAEAGQARITQSRRRLASSAVRRPVVPMAGEE